MVETQKYKVFVVMHSGELYFPNAELEKIDEKATPLGTFWAKVYRVISRPSTWIVYYGEHVLGYSYVRFVHSKGEAQEIVRNWIVRHEV